MRRVHCIAALGLAACRGPSDIVLLDDLSRLVPAAAALRKAILAAG